jgi:hypothetical protein
MKNKFQINFHEKEKNRAKNHLKMENGEYKV